MSFSMIINHKDKDDNTWVYYRAATEDKVAVSRMFLGKGDYIKDAGKPRIGAWKKGHRTESPDFVREVMDEQRWLALLKEDAEVPPGNDVPPSQALLQPPHDAEAAGHGNEGEGDEAGEEEGTLPPSEAAAEEGMTHNQDEAASLEAARGADPEDPFGFGFGMSQEGHDMEGNQAAGTGGASSGATPQLDVPVKLEQTDVVVQANKRFKSLSGAVSRIIDIAEDSD